MNSEKNYMLEFEHLLHINKRMMLIMNSEKNYMCSVREGSWAALESESLTDVKLVDHELRKKLYV